MRIDALAGTDGEMAHPMLPRLEEQLRKIVIRSRRLIAQASRTS
jgi:hypothetical protein